VSPAALTITANGQSKPYGTNLALGTTGFTTSTLYNADTVTGVTLASAGAAASATVSGGPYAITPSAATGTGISNYNITYASGLLAVSPAVLSYVADVIGIPFGSAIPTLTGAVTGFVNGETLASATSGTPVFSTTATASSAPGTYAVTGSGVTALNGDYTFNQSPSNATALTISVVNTPPPDISGFTSSQLGLQGDRPTDLDSVTALLDHSDSTSVDTVFVTQHEVTSLSISVDSAAQSGPIATLTVDGNGYIEPPTSADQLSTSLSQYYGNGSSSDGSYPGWGNQALWY
jgi:hypothetical protein